MKTITTEENYYGVSSGQCYFIYMFQVQGSEILRRLIADNGWAPVDSTPLTQLATAIETRNIEAAQRYIRQKHTRNH